MDFNSNPMLQSGMRKISMFLLGWFVLEIACFIVAGYFIGGWNVFWIQFGTLILGYIIKPAKKNNVPGMMPGLGGGLPTGRGIAAILLMIPGFISDLIALVMLIPPVRKLALGLVMRKFMPKQTNDLLGQFDPAMMERMARQFGNMNAPQNVDLGKQPKSKKKRDKKHSEVIDIDAETSDRKKNMASAEVVRPFNKQPHALIEDKDVVDVTYEIEE